MKGKNDPNRKNIKGNCEKCSEHGICAAEVNTPHYYCPKTNEKQNSN